MNMETRLHNKIRSNAVCVWTDDYSPTHSGNFILYSENVCVQRRKNIGVAWALKGPKFFYVEGAPSRGPV